MKIGIRACVGEREGEFAGGGVEAEEGGIELTTRNSFDKIGGWKG